MTNEQIRALGPAFAAELRRYRGCFTQDRTAAHFHTYCRGLLSDLPRKSVEPIALAAGTAVRTLQEFLVTCTWDHVTARDRLQQRMAEQLAELPPDPLGVIGVIDETSAVKKGDKTPGVQRQYLGCVGKIDNGIVTVHMGVAMGHFQTLLDAELYLPQSWATDRERCRAAGVPDTVRYRSKWRIALDQLLRLNANGIRFDWLTFDEGYGSKGPFLWVLGLVQQKFVAEVPKSFAVRSTPGGRSRRADAHQPATRVGRWRRFRIGRATQADAVWRARRVRVWVARGWHTLVTAVNEATGEVKRFVTNAVGESLATVLGVAFRRATVEHAFRVVKTELGLTHFEGRQYVGLERHLLLTLIVMGFVAVHTERLRGEKSTGDAGAGVSGVERGVPPPIPPTAGRAGPAACRRGDPLPPATERAGHAIPQETAA
ncbi:MAG: IS701 family transposase [Bacteroidales bacterium]|nr:IS701 family transposase [Bacteroidales bacterium]